MKNLIITLAVLAVFATGAWAGAELTAAEKIIDLDRARLAETQKANEGAIHAMVVKGTLSMKESGYIYTRLRSDEAAADLRARLAKTIQGLYSEKSLKAIVAFYETPEGADWARTRIKRRNALNKASADWGNDWAGRGLDDSRRGR